VACDRRKKSFSTLLQIVRNSFRSIYLIAFNFISVINRRKLNQIIID